MLTPRFSLSQDDRQLTITIRAPYCNLKDFETYVEGNDFRFVCSPYYLRLCLPGDIVENDTANAKFISDTGEFILNYAKATEGELFEGLDFITTLLAPRPNKPQASKIEVISSQSEPTETEDDWHIEQQLPLVEANLLTGYGYGFSNSKSTFLDSVQDEFCSVFDLRDASRTSYSERTTQRIQNEDADFSRDHYLADLLDSDEVDGIIAQSSPWSELDQRSVKFSAEEMDVLKELPNMEHLLDAQQEQRVLLGLADVLFGYCYDRRTTLFEGTCESGWTITKLSATLSWFDEFKSAQQLAIAVFRRSLTYPLHRSFSLSERVWQDLLLALSLGAVFVVKCLVDVHGIFNTSTDPRYILNDLYIKDYIVFVQRRAAALPHLHQQLLQVRVDRHALGLDLTDPLDQPLHLSMQKLRVTQADSSCDDSDDSDDSDSSSSASSSSRPCSPGGR